MSQLADKKVQEALQRIHMRRKDGWLQHMLSEVERVDATLDDMNKVGDNLDSMEHVYKEIDKKLDDNEKSNTNQKVYKDIYGSFTKSFQEHMKILSDHAKENIHKLQEDENE